MPGIQTFVFHLKRKITDAKHFANPVPQLLLGIPCGEF
jgi:hypothetical protein